jgi:hypothetical protein
MARASDAREIAPGHASKAVDVVRATSAGTADRIWWVIAGGDAAGQVAAVRDAAMAAHSMPPAMTVILLIRGMIRGMRCRANCKPLHLRGHSHAPRASFHP